MRIEPSMRHASSAVFALALLAMATGTAAAAAGVRPSTAYQFSSHPMISGTVVTVNDHQMVVNTDQGEQVTLELDSKTMAPRDLAPGMVMRAEFQALEDCRFYAQRIMALRDGASPDRLQAYANTRDSEAAMARNTSAYGDHRMSTSQARVTQAQTMGEHSPGTVMIATPTTSDYRSSTRALMSGTAVSVNDHRLVIDTDQGQRVGMVMDSGTMVPGAVEGGSLLRVEFTPMKDGRYYAKRVSRIETSVAAREQAYAHSRDSDLVMAGNPADCGFVSATGNTVSYLERRAAPAEPVQQFERAELPDVLPQTASRQPLFLLFGLLSLGAAGAVAAFRGLRTA